MLELQRESGTDALVLINPNNPTGSYLSFREVKRMLRALPKPVSLILDESLIHFAHDKDDVLPTA